jgi:hypothetical protein
VRSQCLEEALETARNITEIAFRLRALEALAPRLCEPLRSQCLECLEQTQEETRLPRIRELEGLQLFWMTVEPHLAEASLGQALKAARAIGDELVRLDALVRLAPRLSAQSPGALYPLWRQTLPILANRTRSNLLSDLGALLPIILRLGGAQAAAALFTAIQDVGRWWP